MNRGGMNRGGPDLVVIGAGLMGLSVALEARSRGLSVLILEAETSARHASSASAGGVRSLNRHPAEIALTRAALPLWAGLADRLGRDCGFCRSGQVRVAEDAEAMQALEARAEATAALGFDHERLIPRADLRARIPAIAAHCLGALVVDDDGFADPLATSHAYRQAALRAGVDLRDHSRVTGLEQTAQGIAVATDGGTVRAGSVVNAAGAWGNRIARLAGDDLPLRPAALMMTVTAPMPAFVAPVVGTQGRKLSLKQTAAGAVVIGGGFEGDIAADSTGPLRGTPRADLSVRNLANAVALFPILREARVARTWAGLEGITPDGLPCLGPSATLPGLIHAFGFSGHGFALVPVIGPIVADLLAGKRTTLDCSAFAPSRFGKTAPAAQLSREKDHVA